MGLKLNSVYLDSCLVIYLGEENPVFVLRLENHIQNSSNLTYIVSDLTKMECLVIPFRNNNQVLVNKFEGWFEQVEVVSLNREIFRQAAKLRADFPSLKTPEALHLATAIHNNCDEFWTNDNRLHKVAPSIVQNIINN